MMVVKHTCWKGFFENTRFSFRMPQHVFLSFFKLLTSGVVARNVSCFQERHFGFRCPCCKCLKWRWTEVIIARWHFFFFLHVHYVVLCLASAIALYRLFPTYYHNSLFLLCLSCRIVCIYQNMIPCGLLFVVQAKEQVFVGWLSVSCCGGGRPSRMASYELVCTSGTLGN